MVIKNLWIPIANFIVFIIILRLLICFWGINKIENINGEAIFAALVTIFVFGSGLFAKTIEDKLKQLKKDNQLKRVFNSNLRTIAEGLKLQIDDYSKAIRTLKSSSPDNVMVSSFAELGYFEINNIDSKDLYRVFIDNLKGDENGKINTLENLRKQLRFIENSEKNIFSNFEKLYDSFHNSSNKVIDGMKELGEYFDKEATRLSNSGGDINDDNWFVIFSVILDSAHSVFRTSDDTSTDYKKLEETIIPEFQRFVRK